MTPTLHTGDAAAILSTLPEKSVQCCVTSPPYFGLRDYGVEGQMGLEETPEKFVAGMAAVFSQVKRVLRDDGTLWLNIDDSYASQAGPQVKQTKWAVEGASGGQGGGRSRRPPAGVKTKDLIGIPWMLAFALRADGWYLRSDIIWAKPNPMPESVRDRPTRAHEYVFLLSKSERYFYDADAIRTPMKESSVERLSQDVESQEGSRRANGATREDRPMKALFPHGSIEARKARAKPDAKSAPTAMRNGIRAPAADKQRGHSRRHAGFNARWGAMSKEEQQLGGANARSVWSIATRPYRGAHFATFPPELARRCILAGSAPGDTVLDPFGGSGTTAAIATELARNSIYIDLNPKYVELARQRIAASEGRMQEELLALI